MKLLSFSVLLSSILFTFNYVWINRITVIEQSDKHSLIINKWTGNHCIFYSDERLRFHPDTGQVWWCSVEDNKIELP
jgi:hypothetical protein